MMTRRKMIPEIGNDKRKVNIRLLTISKLYPAFSSDMLVSFVLVADFVFNRGGIKPWRTPDKEVRSNPLVLAWVTNVLTNPDLYIEFRVQTPWPQRP